MKNHYSLMQKILTKCATCGKSMMIEVRVTGKTIETFALCPKCITKMEYEIGSDDVGDALLNDIVDRVAGI